MDAGGADGMRGVRVGSRVADGVRRGPCPCPANSSGPAWRARRRWPGPRAPRWRPPRWQSRSRRTCPSTARPARYRRAPAGAAGRAGCAGWRNRRARAPPRRQQRQRHQAAHAQRAEGRQGAQEGPDLPGRQPVLAVLARGIDLHEHVERAPSACRRRSSTSARCRLSSAWNSSAKRATTLALLLCRWPITDQRSRAGRPVPPACGWLPAPCFAQHAAAGRIGQRMRASSTVLLTGSRRTSAGSRPARARRRDAGPHLGQVTAEVVDRAGVRIEAVVFVPGRRGTGMDRAEQASRGPPARGGSLAAGCRRRP